MLFEYYSNTAVHVFTAEQYSSTTAVGSYGPYRSEILGGLRAESVFVRLTTSSSTAVRMVVCMGALLSFFLGVVWLLLVGRRGWPATASQLRVSRPAVPRHLRLACAASTEPAPALPASPPGETCAAVEGGRSGEHRRLGAPERAPRPAPRSGARAAPARKDASLARPTPASGSRSGEAATARLPAAGGASTAGCAARKTWRGDSYLDLQALHDALGIHLRDVYEHRAVQRWQRTDEALPPPIQVLPIHRPDHSRGSRTVNVRNCPCSCPCLRPMRRRL